MYCAQCGQQMSENATVCSCGWNSQAPGIPANPYAAPPTAGMQPPMFPQQGYEAPKPDLGMRMLIPIGRSGYAIAAGYLGLLSLLAFPAPFAILFGVLAIYDMKKNPKLTGMGRAVFGIVMGVIGSLLLAFGILSGLISGRR